MFRAHKCFDLRPVSTTSSYTASTLISRQAKRGKPLNVASSVSYSEYSHPSDSGDARRIHA